MRYIDAVQGDILTEEEMQERVHEYIDKDDIIETMYENDLWSIFKEMSDDQKNNIYLQTVDRVLSERLYFCEYDDEEDE